MTTIKWLKHFLCDLLIYNQNQKTQVKWFQTNTLRVERECGFALGNRWISVLSRPRSAGAAERAQIKLDCKGLNIHWGPRYCQQNCPILFTFDSKFWGCVLGITYFVVVNSVQTRNKMWCDDETAVENDSMTWFILSQMGCHQAKRKFTFTLLSPQKLWCSTFVIFLLHGDKA